jgi:hypothetical protein
LLFFLHGLCLNKVCCFKKKRLLMMNLQDVVLRLGSLSVVLYKMKLPFMESIGRFTNPFFSQDNPISI